LWGESFIKPRFRYPYLAGDGRENLEAPAHELRVLRGGSFHGFNLVVRCATRGWSNPDFGDGFVGFRVVLAPFRSGL
jgi:formylglycine-generating enzyme required for sulfatase activity